MPTVPVDDILIHPRDNDLILATHGRSIWVMDDITAMSQLNPSVMDSKLFLFDPRQAVMWRTWNNRAITSNKVFYGENPQAGGYINFYLKDNLADRESVLRSLLRTPRERLSALRTVRGSIRIRPRLLLLAPAAEAAVEAVVEAAVEVLVALAVAEEAAVMPLKVSTVGFGTSEVELRPSQGRPERLRVAKAHLQAAVEAEVLAALAADKAHGSIRATTRSR